jgi:pyruvate-ferredoxin/flavodoxin oxidoreductase
MAGLRNIAIHWYRTVFGAPAEADIREEGLETVLDGNSAVALTEAGIAGHAVLGGSFPSDDADSVWLGELAAGNANLLGEAQSAQSAEGPRGIVAAATGLALAGRRATAFLSGQDITAAQDLLISAAGKHVPLVLHLGTRSATAHGGALGSGHDAVHLGADTGFFMLFAMNVQQAVDFTVIARRVTEQALVPGMVIMDGEQTAIAAQDVRLCSPAQLHRYLGSATQAIESPTAAQKLLFGETRRQVPAWHDLDEPVLTGALFEPDSFALGAFARRAYFDHYVEESLAEAIGQFAEITGRRCELISRYEMHNATTVLLAQGAAIETARAAADHLRNQHKVRVGVLGVHSLRPFPAAAVVDALSGHQRVFVLERADAHLSDEPPLTREVRASLNRLSNDRQPHCCAVIFGVGGLPLRVADLIELCDSKNIDSASPRFLGLAFDDTTGRQPKREVLLDALRRAYPAIGDLGVRAPRDAAQPRNKSSLTIAIQRRGGRDARGIMGAVGALLYMLEGGRVRSRPAVAWRHGTQARTDFVTHGDDTLHDPGDGLSADITMEVSSGLLTLGDNRRVFRVPLETPGEPRDGQIDETLLGGLFGVLLAENRVESKARQIIAARRRMLETLDDDRVETLMAAFQAGLEQVAEAGGDSGENEAKNKSTDSGRQTPAAVLHLARDDDHYASLPRFWDQLGELVRTGKANGLTPDPYFATGTMPPLSSTFHDVGGPHRMLPTFNPALCTGCGLCWTQCPDSAIGVAALPPAALVDAGIQRTGAEAVRQVASKVASRIIASNKPVESTATTFGQMLDESFGWLRDKMPLPDDRKQAISAGIESIIGEFGSLPVAVTTPFFHRPEALKKDSAELLSLVINPDACKDCGLCIDSCEPGALFAGEQDSESLEKARELWSVWSRTPDTSSETIERVALDSDVGKLPGMLLSRYCQFALAGGDSAEGGSGEKIAVRLMLSATEFHQQPLVQRFARTLFEAGESISALINETLSGTLAVEDLDAVTEQLKRTTSPRVDLKTLVEGSGETSADHSIDTAYLLRLIDLSNQISSAHHRLVHGRHGLGRARYGVALSGGSTATWAGVFPHNPFQAPVLVDMSGDAAQLAAGLIEGHLEETTELVRLLRLARLEAEQVDGIEWKRKALDALRWKDLSDEEYELCPPMLLVGSDEMLAGRGLGQLMWLLNSRLPIKVLVLSSQDFGLATDPAVEKAQLPTNNPRASLSLLALAQRRALVAQSSLGDPKHLADSLLQALGHNGPALVQVYAPSPTQHGFVSDQTVRHAEHAVKCRVMPLFRYDPASAGVFGTRLSLDGNPEIKELMVPVGSDEQRLTPADWAIRQKRFSTNFRSLSDDAPTPVALSEWLQLDATSRARKTPYVSLGDGAEEQRYSMAPAMIDMATQCLEVWQTLQELAGIATPFTERVEQEIRQQVAAEHQAELDAQKKESEAQIRSIQEKVEAEIAAKIRSRLLDLASRKRS